LKNELNYGMINQVISSESGAKNRPQSVSLTTKQKLSLVQLFLASGNLGQGA
jgi:hypothetical protein